MTNKNPIAFIDSGVGGLPYLLWVRQNIPGESLVYLADHAHFPYGIKEPQEISTILIGQIHKLIEKENPKLLVIACNSASVSALDSLRETFDIPVVGVVPAVKLAAELSPTGNVGIWATKTTLKTAYLDNLVSQYAKDCRITSHGATELVDFIEENLTRSNHEIFKDVLKPYIQEMMAQNVDHLVLGCTHFTFLYPYIEELSQGTIKPVDSREGVGKQIARLLVGKSSSSLELNREYRFYVSEEREGDFYRKIASHFDLEYGGIL